MFIRDTDGGVLADYIFALALTLAAMVAIVAGMLL